MAESSLFYRRNPEWPETFEWNAESRVGGSGIWTIFEAESESKALYGIWLSTFFNLKTENIINSKLISMQVCHM